ncbi:MAG: AMP-binding protein [Gordonia sp. (in: high G+C Gram-positive bacteria)]
MTSRLRTVPGRVVGVVWTIRVLLRSGFLGSARPGAGRCVARPDRYARMALNLRRHGGPSPVSGIGLAAARTPHHVALIDEVGRLTWAELDRRTDALAAGLTEVLGATPSPHRPGAPARIAIMCRNHRGLIESLAASSRIGADAILLNTGFAGPQCAEVIKRERVDLLIVDDEFASLVSAAAAEVPALRCLRAWADPTAAPGPNTVGTLAGLIAAHAGERAARPLRAGRIVLLTSGTTGTPKGAKRGGSTDISSLAAMLDRIPWRSGEAIVIAAPVFHAWGFGQVAVASTMSVTMIMQRRFDPKATMELVAEHHATGLAVVPVMIERIMDLPPAELARISVPNLRFVTASGSRMRSDAVLGFMNRFGDVVYNSYNATEAGLIATATPADLRDAPETAGRPLTGTDVRILDDAGHDLPVGAIGRVAVASNSAFDGYTSTDAKEFAGRHMLSGDLGRFDESGRLYVVGRDDEMIVSGGENVYPLEIEQALGDHDAVAEVSVIGVDDDRFGQRLAAYVVTRPGATVTAAELKQHVRDRLAGFKVPRDVHFLTELPRNATGKVVKRLLARDDPADDPSTPG